MKAMMLLLIAVLLAGCSSSLKRADVESALRRQSPVFDDVEVERIEAIRPQIELPMRIAISQPLQGETWSPAEIDEITTWSRSLERAGVASQVVVLPEMMIRSCDPRDSRCSVEAQRRAAARVGADTLLLLNPATRVDSYVNVLAPLDLTIVGLWLAPAHQRDGMTLLEGTLIDNRNQYVYAVARGEALEKTTRPFVFAQQSDVAEKSRAAALRDFGLNFVREAERIDGR